jgi:hypothetical protein
MEDKKHLDEILDLADSIQEEWFKYSEEVMKHAKSRGKEIHYADLKDTFFYMKIAELQKQVKTLKYEIGVLQEWKLNKEGI